MEKLGIDFDDFLSPADQKQLNPQDARKLSIQRCLHSLVRACHCREGNCRLPNCQKMKRNIQHCKVCNLKVNGNCPICKQLIALCCYHAKYCPETKCPVPFCLNIRDKMKQQQLQQQEEDARQQAPQGTLGYPGIAAPPNVQQVMPPPQRSIQVPGPLLLSMDQWPRDQSQVGMQTGTGGPGAVMSGPPGGAQGGTPGPQIGATPEQPVMQLGGQVSSAQAAGMRQPAPPGQTQQANSSVQDLYIDI